MPQRLIKAFCLLIIAVIALSSCSAKIPVKKTEYLLGTIISVTIYDCPGSEGIIDECFDMISDFESRVSSTNVNSSVSMLNNSAYDDYVTPDSEVYSLIKDSLTFCEESGGAFDIGLGKLIDLWGIGTEKEAVPDMNKLEPYIGFKGFEHIFLNNEQRTIRYDDERVSINLGACAKGYAVDKAVSFLKEKGVKSAMLDFGGSIYTIGNKNGTGFDVGIANPDGNSIGGIIYGLSDISVVTSGDYQRFFEQNGKRYHHILDSNSGYPSESRVRSVTVVCHDAFMGDCLSTAAFVIGVEKGSELLEKYNCGYVFFDDNGVTVSDNLKDKFRLVYE